MASPATARPRQNFILRGLITLLPAVLTIVVLTILIQFVNRYVTNPVNAFLYWSLERNALGWKALSLMEIDPADIDFVDTDALPGELQDLARRDGVSNDVFRERLAEYRSERRGILRNLQGLGIDQDKLRQAVTAQVHPLVGVVLSLLLVIGACYLAGGFLGHHLIASLDRALQALPVVRSVHPHAKQIVDFFLSEKKLEFENVVALQFFNPGIWSVGFVTGSGMKSLRERLGGRVLTVFVPSSPVPMTGYTVFVDAREVVSLSISVDDAARIIVSGGVLIPPAESVEELERELGRTAAGVRETPNT